MESLTVKCPSLAINPIPCIKGRGYSGFILIAVIHWPKATQGGKGLSNLISCPDPLWWYIRAGTLAQAMQECCSVACSHGSISLHSYITKDCQAMGSTNHHGRSSPASIIKLRKWSQRRTNWMIWWRPLINSGSLFSDDPIVCQADTKLTSTEALGWVSFIAKNL